MYPNHRIRINIPPLGYEDFLVRMAQTYDYKILVGRARFNLLKKLLSDYNFTTSLDGARILITRDEISHSYDTIEKYRHLNK